MEEEQKQELVFGANFISLDIVLLRMYIHVL